MAAHPTIHCECGQQLTSADAVSRVFISETAGWERFYLRFRCPRCRRPSERHFETRSDDGALRDGETYEQIAPSTFGPITREEQDRARQALEGPITKEAIEKIA